MENWLLYSNPNEPDNICNSVIPRIIKGFRYVFQFGMIFVDYLSKFVVNGWIL